MTEDLKPYANEQHNEQPAAASLSASEEAALTPMMLQYSRIKREYSDAILFFRLGDFYEMFGEDAVIASRILQITLTSRDKNKENATPLCGVPYHAAEGYVARLIREGYTVAICDQVEDPKKAKGIVQREVTRVVTPGTIIDSNLLEGKENNFLASLTLHSFSNSSRFGLTFADISTGELWVTEYEGEDWYQKLETELFRKSPREMVIPRSLAADHLLRKIWVQIPHIRIEYRDDAQYHKSDAGKCLKEHFQVHSLSGLGCEEKEMATLSAAAAIRYLQKTQKRDLSHLRRLRWYHLNDFMIIDAVTVQHLELIASWKDSRKSGSLLAILDLTETSMGGRMLKQWLLHPLLTVEDINLRLDAVEFLADHENMRQQLRELLKKVYDLERISGKIALSSASAQDLIALKSSIAFIPRIKALFLHQEPSSLPPPPLVASLKEECDELQDLYQWIDEGLADPPPSLSQDVGMIREGYSAELDELRQIAFEGKTWIARMENEERQKTGISSLKIKYNKVFGYYIEVTRSHLGSVPDHYVRKQTIANGERYITAELKDYETRVLTAHEKMAQMEKSLFQEILARLTGQVKRMQETAKALATLDVLTALAEAAKRYHYVKPVVNSESAIHIIEGRHPVVEHLSKDEAFVPNDVHLDGKNNQLLIITGPNMAGKSTYIRQVALITLMAHLGSFVPAQEAAISLVDRIFTRVGASDNLSRGQSTFMVEMNETANILNNATSRSLIILDEIGRGTSTFDGISIAWAVAEYLEKTGAKTLFATHYHELTRLSDSLEKVQNYSVAVREWNNEVIFLRRIMAGSTDKSYGIQVARLAGLPHEVIERAGEILKSLEKQNAQATVQPDDFPLRSSGAPRKSRQLSLFTSPEEYVASELRALDTAKLPAQDALKILKRWQKLLE
ncbi:MAG: DNA mismatch repair protein MutS [bacterium]